MSCVYSERVSTHISELFLSTYFISMYTNDTKAYYWKWICKILDKLWLNEQSQSGFKDKKEAALSNTMCGWKKASRSTEGVFTHLLMYSPVRTRPQVWHLKQLTCHCFSNARRDWPCLISSLQPAHSKKSHKEDKRAYIMDLRFRSLPCVQSALTG